MPHQRRIESLTEDSSSRDNYENFRLNVTASLNAQYGLPAIVIPSDILPIQEYLVTVRMVNFMCYWGESTLTVEKRLNEPPNTRANSPQYQTVSRGDTVQFGIDAKSPICTSSSGSLGFRWSSGPVSCDAIACPLCDANPTDKACGPTLNPKYLLISPYTLAINQEHRFSIETFLESNALLKSTTNFTVLVLPTNVIASIAGGSRTSLLGLPFSLDASSSHNPDYIPGDTSMDAEVVFLWTCSVAAYKPASFANHTGIVSDSSSSSTICSIADPLYEATGLFCLRCILIN